MGTHQPRLELLIDVFERKSQRALTLPSLTPPALVTAVLQEFRELDYLGDRPDDYMLLRASDGQALDPATPVGQQLGAQEQLVLVEYEAPLPPGTQRPTRPVYLREQAMGIVYRLHWLPAIIGRLDEHQEYHDRLAVDLSAHSAGLRVSRRHAQLVEADGQFYVERLSQNSTLVKDAWGAIMPVEQERQPLHHGDTIVLERSQLALKFIVREEEQAV